MGRWKSSEYWMELVAQYEVEKEYTTQDEFAHAYNVSPSTFKYWLYRIRKDERESKPILGNFPFVEVSVEEERPITGENGKGLALYVGGELRVSFESLPPAEYLVYLLNTLESSSC